MGHIDLDRIGISLVITSLDLALWNVIETHTKYLLGTRLILLATLVG